MTHARPLLLGALLLAGGWGARGAAVKRLAVFSNAPAWDGYRHTSRLLSVQKDWEASPYRDRGLEIRHPCDEHSPASPACDAVAAINTSTTPLEEIIQLLDAARWQNASEVAAAVGAFAAGAPTSVILGLDVGAFPEELAAAHPQARFVELALSLDNATGYSQGGADNLKVLTLNKARTEYLNGVMAGLVATDKHGAVAVLAPAGNATAGANASAGVANRASRYFRQGVIDVAPDVCIFNVQVDLDSNGATTFAHGYAEVHRVAFDTYRTTDVIYVAGLDDYEEAVLAAAADIWKSNYKAYAVTSSGQQPVGSSLTGNAEVALSGVSLDYLKLFVLVNDGATKGPLSKDPEYPMWADPLVKSTPQPLPKMAKCTLSGSSLKSHDALLEAAWQQREGYGALPALGTVPEPAAECAATGEEAPPALPKAKAYWNAVRDLSLQCFSQETNQVRLVGVGMYLNHMGHVDLKTGVFSVDYNLYFHQWKTRFGTYEAADATLTASGECADPGRPCVCPPMSENEWENYAGGEEVQETVNFVNAERLHSIRPVYKDGEGKSSLLQYFRVQGNYVFRPNLHNWPFDSQRLSLELEDIVKTANDDIPVRFCHLTNYSGLAPTGRYFPGMDMKPGAKIWEVALGTSCWPSLEYPLDYQNGVCEDGVHNPQPVMYPAAKFPDADASCTCLGGTRAASRYTMTIGFDRPKTLSFMKYFLPPMFITLVNTGVWFLYPKLYETRLGVCGSSLISEVMFHVSLTQDNPDTSVLTMADRLMVTLYFNNLLAFMAVFAQAIMFQAEYEGLVWRFFRATRLWGPLNVFATGFAVVVCETIEGVMVFNATATLITFLLSWCCLLPCTARLAPKFHRVLRHSDARHRKSKYTSPLNSSRTTVDPSLGSPFLARPRKNTEMEHVGLIDDAHADSSHDTVD
eukprot:TRINITY_DN12272_c0_g1_i1.p1 TRINITY_DN12272_c0_g1~~TRINITY_DN12272_c0_g1_i1.p1  ORF type:complete len:919 (+),score=292.76 TRINITY_DN12272_c0_g1_i1:43-2799(+)